jgi:hypothetical protein
MVVVVVLGGRQVRLQLVMLVQRVGYTVAERV